MSIKANADIFIFQAIFQQIIISSICLIIITLFVQVAFLQFHKIRP